MANRILVGLLALLPLTSSLSSPAEAQERTLAELDSAVAKIEADLARIRAAWAGDSTGGPIIIPPPNPDPGDSLPPVGDPDPRLIAGPFPMLGYGAEAGQACGPAVDGMPWRIQVEKVTATRDLATVFDELSPEPALVVVVFETGGRHNINALLRNSPRKHCIIVAGHTAPEIYWVAQVGANGRNAGAARDLIFRGLGAIGHGVSGFVAVCTRNVYADLLSIAFARNDAVGITSDGCGDRTSFGRSIVGPVAGELSASGSHTGRGGGVFDGAGNTAECAEISYFDVIGIEPQRRLPLFECSGNLTNTLTYNSTEGARLQKPGIKLNLRGNVHVGGPVTGCALDRGPAIIFDQSDLVDPATSQYELYLEGNVSVPAAGCSWIPTAAQWPADSTTTHTVLHFSRAASPVPFQGFGVSIPHAGPLFEAPVRSWPALEPALHAFAGASMGLSCSGAWVRRQNDLDDVNLDRMQGRDFAPRSWLSEEEWEAANGELEFPVGTACADSNDNGIPDEAEMLLSGSATGIEDVGSLAPSGRPWMLEYLSGR